MCFLLRIYIFFFSYRITATDEETEEIACRISDSNLGLGLSLPVNYCLCSELPRPMGHKLIKYRVICLIMFQAHLPASHRLPT